MWYGNISCDPQTLVFIKKKKKRCCSNLRDAVTTCASRLGLLYPSKKKQKKQTRLLTEAPSRFTLCPWAIPLDWFDLSPKVHAFKFLCDWALSQRIVRETRIHSEKYSGRISWSFLFLVLCCDNFEKCLFWLCTKTERDGQLVACFLHITHSRFVFTNL